MNTQLKVGRLVVGQHPELTDEVTLVAKPVGGLWTSTWDGEESEWVDWCRREEFGDVDSREWWLLTPSPTARILTIETRYNLMQAVKMFAPPAGSYPEWYSGLGAAVLDFTAVAKKFDAVHLTSRGAIDLHFGTPNLNSWDCESTVWFRWVFDKAVRIK
jgi:hypothetical protein